MYFLNTLNIFIIILNTLTSNIYLYMMSITYTAFKLNAWNINNVIYLYIYIIDVINTIVFIQTLNDSIYFIY